MSTECPEENELVDLVTGNLEPAASERAEAHIDACSSCRAVLTQLARVFELRASSLPEPHHETTDRSAGEEAAFARRGYALPPGAKVGRYVVLEVLGAGAMGVVYAAFDPDLDRRIALKLLHGGEVGKTRDARLVREARATARLSHPNVVVVHEVGEHDGAVFMAMEYVTGGTLGEWLEATSRTRAQITAAFIDAGRGLQAAHKAGLVHRDFKPANVLVGSDGRVRVTDFGLARPGASAEHPSATTLESGDHASVLEYSVTRTGAVVGTPAYMSPEQFAGEVADARSDQFSFCVALVEALCGDRPFCGERFAELAANVKGGRVRSALLDALPRRLREALRRGLQVQPASRFADMEALLRELVLATDRSGRRAGVRALLLSAAVVASVGATWAVGERASDPVELCEPGSTSLDDTWNGSRAAQIESALAAVDRPAASKVAQTVRAGLDGYATAWVDERTRACEEPEAYSASARYSALRCLDRGRLELDALATALGEDAATSLEHASEAVMRLRAPATCAQPNARDLERELEPPEELRSQVRTLQGRLGIARAYLQTGQYQPGFERASSVAQLAEGVGFGPLVAEAKYVIGSAQVGLGDYDAAEISFRASLRESIISGLDDMLLRVTGALIDVVGNEQGEADDVQVWEEIASAALVRAGEASPSAPDYWTALGKLAAGRGDYAHARALFEKVLAQSEIDAGQRVVAMSGLVAVASLGGAAAGNVDAIAKGRALLAFETRTFGPEHPHLVVGHSNLAAALVSIGKGEEAAEHIDAALRIASEIWAEGDNRLAPLHTTQARVRGVLGDAEGARDASLRALEIWKLSRDPNDPQIGLAHNNLAVAELGLGNYEASTGHLELALPIFEKSFGPQHPNVASCHTTISSNLVQVGRYAEARAHLEVASKIAGDLEHPNEVLWAIVSHNYARVELHDGELAAAAAHADEAVKHAVDGYGEAHPVLAKLLVTQAEVAVARGEFESARAASTRGLEIATAGSAKQTRSRLLLAMGAAARGEGNTTECERVVAEARALARDDTRSADASAYDCGKTPSPARRRG